MSYPAEKTKRVMESLVASGKFHPTLAQLQQIKGWRYLGVRHASRIQRRLAWMARQ